MEMTGLKMRMSIGIKIFSIATGLLVLMALVAVYSFSRTHLVNLEVSNIAYFQIPLKDHLHTIASQAFQQELHVNALMLHNASGHVARERIEQEHALFEALAKQVDNELSIARRLAIQDEGEQGTQADRAEFSRMVPLLDAIENAHQAFEDHARMVANTLAQGNAAQAYAFLAVLAEKKETLNREIENASQEIASFTESSAQEAVAHEQYVLQLNASLTLIAVVLGLAGAFLVTIGLVRPVRRLVDGTHEVERGNLDVQVQVVSRDEIGVLARSFNGMVLELQLKERIKETFGKYIDPRIVEDLIQNPEAVGGQGRMREMTVLFSDIEGFTPIGEKLSPEALVNLLNHYLTMASGPIKRSHGVIDKYIGDAVMAFWGPPFTTEAEHAGAACMTALETFEQLAVFRTRLPEVMGTTEDIPHINIRIGIATGALVVGNIGSDVSKAYTAIGDTVNLASRLEGANKQYGTRTLISEGTQQMVVGLIEMREIDMIQVVGKSKPVRVFEILSAQGALDVERTKLRDRFEAGLGAYRAQDWDRAQVEFEACLAIRADDGPAKTFLDRVAYLRLSPPGSEWNGVWRLDHK